MDDSTKIELALINQVIEWVGLKGKEINQETFESIKKWLQDNIVEWMKLVNEAIRNGRDWGLKKLQEYKDIIIQKLNENKESITAEALLKLFAKSVAKTAAKEITRKTTKVVAKRVGLKASRTLTKEAVKVVVTNSWEEVAKQVFKSGINPISTAADLVQFGLEWTGHKKTGIIVGASGNVLGGAIAGLAGGPVGALIGGAAGLASWGVGELVGGFFK